MVTYFNYSHRRAGKGVSGMERDEIKIGLKGNYAYFKNITVTGINDKHVIMSNVNGDTKEVFKSLFLKYFKEQHTQKKQHCTQCEIGQQNLELIADVERLKEEKQKLLEALRPVAIIGNKVANNISIREHT